MSALFGTGDAREPAPVTFRASISILPAAAGALLAGIGVLSLGGVFSDRLDVLTHFAPLVLLSALAVFIGAMVLARGRRRSVALLASGLAWLSAGALVVPELAAAARPLPPAALHAERLRLLQFNVLRRNADLQATVDYILTVNADVVFLQEAYDEAGPIASALRRRYPHQVTCTGRRGRCGTRVLSKRRPISAGHVSRGREDGSLGAAWIGLPLRDGGQATVVGTHYTWPIPAGPQQAQSRALSGILRDFDQETLIVAGDFNSTPWSFSLRGQDRAFGIERRTRALFSWPRFVRGVPSPAPFLPIDHVYAGPGWTTVSVRRGPRTPSDHYPIVVELARTSLANGGS